MIGGMVLVRTTVEDNEQARSLAGRLVDEGLAACVHVQAITSFYRWKGEFEESQEWLVEARCVVEKAEAARAFVVENHPYEVPMVEMVEVRGVPELYLEWARRGR